MKILILILALIGIFTNSYSQLKLLWSNNFTTELRDWDRECPTIQADADTIKLVGRKNTPNGQKLLIVKYNLNGDTISIQTYGNHSPYNTVIDYEFDSFNHIYLLQKEYLKHNKDKIVLEKYSLNGSLIWDKQIQSAADTSFTPRSLGLANDTCLFIAAHKEYNYPEPGDLVDNTITLPYLYAYNVNGNQMWEREFNPNTEISWFANDMFVHNNTAFLYTLGSRSRLLKVDINNTLTINSTELENGFYNVQLTPDSNLLVSSKTEYRIYKTDLNGTILWTEFYGTNLTRPGGDEIKATIQDSYGDIYITGEHYGDGRNTPEYSFSDILTVKYDKTGKFIWENRYEYGVQNLDVANFITLKKGNLYVGGKSQRLGFGSDFDYILLKINSVNGATNATYRYNGTANGHDVVHSLHIFDDGKIALAGLSYINSGYDWTTQLLSDEAFTTITSFDNNNINNDIEVFPNPLNIGEWLFIKGEGLKLYSIISLIGEVVQQGKLSRKDLNTIHINNLKTGLYLIRLKTDNKILTRKIMVK